MQNRSTLERRSTSSRQEECVDEPGRCAVHLEAISRRVCRYARLCQSESARHCEFLAVLSYRLVVFVVTKNALNQGTKQVIYFSKIKTYSPDKLHRVA